MHDTLNNYLIKTKYYLKKSLIKNSFYIMVTTLAIYGSGFIFWMLASRIFSSREVGLASVMIEAMTLITMLSMLGFNISLIRFLPNSIKKKSLINSSFILSLITSVIVSFIFLMQIQKIVPSISFLSLNYSFAFIFILFTCVSTLTALVNSIFIAIRISRYLLIKNSIFGIFRIPLLLIVFPLGEFGIFFSWGVGTIIAFIVGIFLINKVIPEFKAEMEFEMPIITELFTYSFGNYIANFLNMAPSMILPLIISSILLPEYAAFFWISWSIANLLFAIPTGISQSLLAEGSNNEEKIKNIKLSIQFMLSLLVPSVVFILIFADNLLLLFGSDYLKEGSSLVRILAISSIPYSINILYIAVMNVNKNVKEIIKIYAIIAICTLLLSYHMLLEWGIIAIGYAWLIGNVITIPFIAYDVLVYNKYFINSLMARNING